MAEKVLIITEVFYPEEFIINDLVDEWLEQGKEIDVLTRNPSYPFGKIYPGFKNNLYSKSKYKTATVHRYHIITWYKKNTFFKVLNYLWNSLLSTIICLIKFRKAENIFIHQTGPLTLAFPAIVLKFFFKSKVTIWTQDIWPDVVYSYGFKKNGFSIKILDWFVNLIYKNCDEIITTSPAFKKSISKNKGLQEIQFVPNWAVGIFGSIQPAKSKEVNKQIQFAFAGNIGKLQNLDNVLEAFSKWNKNEHAILNIYGDGSHLNHLKNRFSSENNNNIIFHGRKPQSEIPEIYQKNDVLIIALADDPTLELYIPAKFSTYLSSGKPIFGILNGVVSTLISQHNVGTIAKPNDIQEIIEGFDYFYNLSEIEKEEISQNADVLFFDIFQREKNIQKLSEVVWD